VIENGVDPPQKRPAKGRKAVADQLVQSFAVVYPAHFDGAAGMCIVHQT
jgi:hypothetical protein